MAIEEVFIVDCWHGTRFRDARCMRERDQGKGGKVSIATLPEKLTLSEVFKRNEFAAWQVELCILINMARPCAILRDAAWREVQGVACVKEMVW